MKPTVSVIMMTRDPASGAPGREIFAAVLASLAWADEICVADCSHDATPALLAAAGARVIRVEPGEDFVAPKRLALALVQTAWILWVDADEVLPPALIAEIQAAVTGAGANAYRLRRLHVFLGRPLSHSGIDSVVRLWRRGHGDFGAATVHETWVVPEPAPELPSALWHYSSPNLQTRFNKMVRSAQQQAAASPDFPEGDGWGYLWRWVLRPPLGTFKHVYLQCGGYRDGIPGLLWAICDALTLFYMHLLIWERSQRRNS